MNIETTIDHEGDTARASRRRRWMVLGVIAAIGLIVVLMLVRHKPPAPTEAALQRITVIEPGRQSVAGAVAASGIIGARHDMPVGVVGEGGMVSQVMVDPGDWVAAGQPLAIIERSVQVQQAAGLAAAVGSARADAALARSNLERARALVKNGFISKADIDAKTAARDQADARVAVAGAQLAEQKARNARLVVRAPAAGLVLTRSVEPGQIVGGQGVLFRVAERGDMEMIARVAEQDLAHLRVGMPAAVTPVGSDAVLRGEIWQLSPIIDPATRQGVARIALRYDRALRPGGFASARLEGGSADMPLLPESAVLSDAKGNFVYVVGHGDTVERRAVKVGDVDDRGVSIASGLSGQEKVVINAGAFLSPGEKILPDLQPARR